ncbi:GntR family transcriptional regulator [Tropicimonas isoalkanivorans]|uniref:GntR family transcriptional regulator n=1 Tax=Tropicimonas isoalkanivorans TaxID=441112 RepID=A0A1I1IN66_9RHOB|nr:GntR family transcriptional regulator [Tropicimonas isoalkanivorans]SFC37687.1 GntR family transcriptional regulator [Tropicimonas isoalkanivorans]
MTSRDRLEEDSRLPAYLRLRDRIAERIAAGEWTAEDALPSENILSREEGLSVGTVRKALQQLVAEGLLERRQGAGTFLRKPAFEPTLFRFFALQGADRTKTIPVSRLVARSVQNAPEEAAEVLGTTDCIRIDRVRLLQDQPILSEEIWLPRERFEGIETVPEVEIGPLLYPFYLERFGAFVAHAEDEVSFASPPKAVAKRLGLAAGEFVAVIERTAFGLDGRPIEWRRSMGPARSFRYRSRIG